MRLLVYGLLGTLLCIAAGCEQKTETAPSVQSQGIPSSETSPPESATPSIDVAVTETEQTPPPIIQAPVTMPVSPNPATQMPTIVSWHFTDIENLIDDGGMHSFHIINGSDGQDVEIIEGGGLSFSGDDSAVVRTNQLAEMLADTSFTLSCWFRVQEFEPGSMLCGFTTRDPSFYVLELRLHDNGGILLNIQDHSKADENNGNNNVAGGSGLNDGSWHHVVGVRNFGKSLSLFIDGKRVRSTVDYGWRIPANARFFLSAIRPFNGDIEEVSLWRRPLSVSEVADLYAEGARGKNL